MVLMRACPWILMMLLISFQAVPGASEFRSFRMIPTPAPTSQTEAQIQSQRFSIKPVSRQLVKKAMDKIIAAWNGNHIDGVLSDEFFDKSRLSDAMNAKVPRDAQLEILAIQAVQTLQQKTADSPSGKLLVSRVSVTAKTQLTFNDPVNGYQRREGVNEYIMRIKQLAR